MKKTHLSFYLLTVVVAPAFASAQVTSASSLLSWIMGLMQTLLGLIMAASVLIFFWGMALFVLNAGSNEGQARGKSLMIWGILALFVMTSVYGLVGFLQKTTGVNNNNMPQVPVLNISGG